MYIFINFFSDFLCWFPIGVLGLMSANDYPVPSEVNVAMAIFVLPLNSALNPFLYTYNTLMEKRRQRKEARLIADIKAKMKEGDVVNLQGSGYYK